MKALALFLTLVATSSLSYAKQSENALSFLVKFDRKTSADKNGRFVGAFRKGELIKAPVVVKVDEKGRAELLVDLNDTRHSDVFIAKLSRTQRKEILAMVGVPAEAVVKIKGPGTYMISNMYRYNTELVSLRTTATLNPSDEQIKAMKNGDRLSLRGTITEIFLNPADKYSDDSHVTLKTSEGRSIFVRLLSGFPMIEENLDPNIANTERKPIEIGDEVLVRGEAEPDGKAGAHWHGSMYLVKASPDRQKRFDILHSTVSAEIKQMRTAVSRNNYEQFRKHVSFVVKNEPTRQELADIRKLNKRIPADERVIVFTDRYAVTELSKTFATDFDSMTKEDFLAFMETYIKFQAPVPNDDGDETYLERVFDQIPLSVKEQIDLNKRVVTAHLERFVTLTKENRMREWGDRSRYAMGQWMNILAYSKPSEELLQWELDLAKRISQLSAELFPGREQNILTDLGQLDYYLTEAISRQKYGLGLNKDIEKVSRK